MKILKIIYLLPREPLYIFHSYFKRWAAWCHKWYAPIWDQTKQNESTRLPSSDVFWNCSLHSPRHLTNCHSLWFSVSLLWPPSICPLTPLPTSARYIFLVLPTIALSHNAIIVRITHRECKKLPYWWFQSSRGDVELGSFSSLSVSCHGILISCSCSLKLACRCCYSLFYVLFFFFLSGRLQDIKLQIPHLISMVQMMMSFWSISDYNRGHDILMK